MPAATPAVSAPPGAVTPTTAPVARVAPAPTDFAGPVIVDAEGGMRAVFIEQPLARDQALVSSQRLASAVSISAALGATAPFGAAADEQLSEFRLFGLKTAASDMTSSGAAQRATGLVGDLNRMREEICEQAQLEHWISGSVAVGSFGLTVGYVLWLLRGGALLASLLSSLPAWRLVDPLPVLSRVDDEEDQDDDEHVFLSFDEAAPPLRPEEAKA
jgi:hypothetical protein